MSFLKSDRGGTESKVSNPGWPSQFLDNTSRRSRSQKIEHRSPDVGRAPAVNRVPVTENNVDSETQVNAHHGRVIPFSGRRNHVDHARALHHDPALLPNDLLVPGEVAG